MSKFAYITESDRSVVKTGFNTKHRETSAVKQGRKIAVLERLSGHSIDDMICMFEMGWTLKEPIKPKGGSYYGTKRWNERSIF